MDKCKLNAFLGYVKDNDIKLPATKTFLSQEFLSRINKSTSPVTKVLFIYYADKGTGCAPYDFPAADDLFPQNIDVEFLVKGQEGTMIDNAQAIAIGAGSLECNINGLRNFQDNIWQKVLGGTPYLSWNGGADLLAGNNLGGSAGDCSEMLSGFTLQVLTNYPELTNPSSVPADVTKLFNDNNTLEFALCLSDVTDGSGIVLEDKKSGLAGGNQTESGGGEPGELQVDPNALYIYGTNGLVPWNVNDPENLPISYM